MGNMKAIGDKEARIENGIRVFLSLLQEKSLILDLGCGNGWASHIMVNEGSEVVAVDLDIIALKKGSLLFKDEINFIQSDINHLPFRRKVFQGVLVNMVLHHLRSADEVINVMYELNRVTKDGGVLLINEIVADNPLYRVSRRLFFSLPKIMKEIIAGEELRAYHPHVTIPLTISLIDFCLRKYGFRIVDEVYFGQVSYLSYLIKLLIGGSIRRKLIHVLKLIGRHLPKSMATGCSLIVVHNPYRAVNRLSD